MPHARLNGIDLHWAERGNGAAVLFLHGFPFNRTLWDAQVASLPAGRRALAPDLRGFGASRDAGKGPLTMEQHAADVVALLDQLRIERTVVCGLSMGGYVALAMLRAAPERLRALVLSDTHAEPDGAAAREARIATADRARREGSAGIVATLLPRLLAESTFTQAPEVVERLRSLMEAASPESIARASLGMAERADSRPLLASIRVPVLVLGGESDALTPPAVLRALAAAIPGARLEQLPDAGHVANLENPAAFDSALHAFLASLPND